MYGRIFLFKKKIFSGLLYEFGKKIFFNLIITWVFEKNSINFLVALILLNELSKRNFAFAYKRLTVRHIFTIAQASFGSQQIFTAFDHFIFFRVVAVECREIFCFIFVKCKYFNSGVGISSYLKRKLI